MPDERLIQEIESILSEIVALGGARERTSIVPNMLVRDASPAGQDDYIIIADNRDNDNILALKVPGIIYADNDLVNVIFPEGGGGYSFSAREPVRQRRFMGNRTRYIYRYFLR